MVKSTQTQRKTKKATSSTTRITSVSPGYNLFSNSVKRASDPKINVFERICLIDSLIGHRCEYLKEKFQVNSRSLNLTVGKCCVILNIIRGKIQTKESTGNLFAYTYRPRINKLEIEELHEKDKKVSKYLQIVSHEIKKWAKSRNFVVHGMAKQFNDTTNDFEKRLEEANQVATEGYQVFLLLSSITGNIKRRFAKDFQSLVEEQNETS